MTPLRILCSILGVGRMVAAIPAGATPFNWETTKAVIAFGDSYTYNGGTAGYPGYSFIGDFLGPDSFSYTPEELLTNQIIANFTGNAEGGPNWIERLTGCAATPDEGLVSPLSCGVQLWDFAFAGSDVSQTYTPLHHNYTIPLVNQTQQFLTYGDAVLRKKTCLQPAHTLVAIWIGINDVSDSAKYNVSAYGASTFAQFYANIIDIIFAHSAQPLVDAGYTQFLFINLPPLDRTPGNIVKDPSARSPNVTQVDWWNSALASRAARFATDNAAAGVTSLLYDVNTFLNGVLDNPAPYGITNTTAFCAGYLYPDVVTDPGKYGCPVPIDQYFWFNTGHLTSHTHGVFTPDLEAFLVKNSVHDN